MSTTIDSTGNNSVDFSIYLVALLTYISPLLLELTDLIDFLCKAVSLVGFIFVALNQGYKFFTKNKNV